ncbi:hypothetical protein EXN32_25205 [Agrobacterium tumefaciens]|uniref:hypothetical protein n=1 Tax=Agrobacterium TaxID=357 RepID=UPI00115E8BFD|nr:MULTISPECIES: hypothetical protein [Agrobacterium]MDA5240621.1 hypothetical protein [Agrobacterium sp. MAFF310724]MDA5250182.1 hypothetical protein [Agrobacterium sp. MAFF210268]TRB10126.1 hypothetical protein EXN32_25205 [Agrobacterium tumefaciens]
MGAAKGRANAGFVDGYKSGYTDFRYGTPKKKVTLAPVFRGDERKRVINEVMDALKDWRDSPFENEGALRSGMRSALCLKGHSWDVSDAEAAALLTASFQHIGVQRPRWDQGQREHTESDGRCIWCFCEIEASQWGTRSKFCSAECATQMRAVRGGEWNQRVSGIARDALRIVKRQALPLIECLHCGTSFRPEEMDKRGRRFCSPTCAAHFHKPARLADCRHCGKSFTMNNHNQKFCSKKCTSVFLRVIKPKECLHCKTMFRPRSRKASYCSLACRDAGSRPAIYPGTCVWCGVRFLGKSPYAKFCSTNHKSMDYQQRSGRKNLKRPVRTVIPFVPMHMLTAEVFDGWFRRAA